MADIKQVIVMRKDLNMRKGKMVSQGGHACLGSYQATPEYIKEAWAYSGQTKICVSVNSEQELIAIYEQAQEAKLPCYLVKDAGLTEFKEPTFTCVGIGPIDSDKVDKITGKLSLL